MTKKAEPNNDGRTVYIVCNNSRECYPRNILRIYNSLDSAYKFLGKYVAESKESIGTGYLSIAAKKIGNDDTIKVIGFDEVFTSE